MDSIFDSIVSVNNLFAAWREFRRGKRRKKDVQEFERNLEDNIFQLHGELANGVYRHGPYRRFHVFDPKHRIIHKAGVRDRLVHHAVYRVLNPVFDRSFIFDSYSCRTGKGTHAAVNRLTTFVRRVSRNYAGPCWALKFDVRKFFDSVDHGILFGILEQKIACLKTNRLLREIVSSYSTPKAVGGGVAT
jgi:retron-type reverse transcriptase